MTTETSMWKTRLNAESIARFVQSGKWSNVTLAHNVADKIVRFKSKVAVVDAAESFTFSEVAKDALHLAEWFRRIGLKPGDVVSFQLPNWYETVTINLAACICELVVNPIVPIYRDAEVGYILNNSRSRVFFMPESFRSIDYVEMLEKLRPSLPDLKAVVIVRGCTNRERYASYGEWGACGTTDPDYVHDLGQSLTDPNSVKMLLYTSGTTGRPKGVLHSHNTIQSEIDAVRKFWNLDQNDVVLMPSPVTHITGYIYGIEMMAAVGCKLVFMDKWDADRAADLVAEHNVTFSVGATPFLSELVAALERRQEVRTSFRLFACGGAPVAPEIIKRAQVVLPNCLSFRLYGSSEAPTVTAGVAPGDPIELGATTDGCILNHEVKIVDPATGELLPDGQEGEILTRGPELMLGYTEWQDTVEAFDNDGYFRTGDLGFKSNGQYITISGRKKDLIIRGGENISAKEVEDILHCHPSVAEVAVVAMPHERMGETPIAYVVFKEGRSISFEEMKTFLEEAKLARQKIPERLFVIDAMPKTASGKIKKHVLRERCREGYDNPMISG